MHYAGGGEDYDSGPYSVKFDAGITEATLNVSIVDDNILEESEKFYLAVNVPSLPDKVSVSDRGQATVTIVDDDGKYMHTTYIIEGMFTGELFQCFSDKTLK